MATLTLVYWIVGLGIAAARSCVSDTLWIDFPVGFVFLTVPVWIYQVWSYD